MFGSRYSSKEFSFCRTGGSDGLGFGFVGNNTTTENKSKASGRSAISKIVGMGSINISSELTRVSGGRKGGKSGVSRQQLDGRRGQGGIRSGFAINDAPGFGLAKVFGDRLEESVVNVMGAS